MWRIENENDWWINKDQEIIEEGVDKTPVPEPPDIKNPAVEKKTEVTEPLIEQFKSDKRVELSQTDIEEPIPEIEIENEIDQAEQGLRRPRRAAKD